MDGFEVCTAKQSLPATAMPSAQRVHPAGGLPSQRPDSRAGSLSCGSSLALEETSGRANRARIATLRPPRKRLTGQAKCEQGLATFVPLLVFKPRHCTMAALASVPDERRRTT